MKTLRWCLMGLALGFLVVPTMPANASDFMPPGMSLEELQRMIERSNRDTDGDGYNDYVDECPQEYGTSTGEMDGCPDSDNDTWADEIDICPHNSDHKTCLSNHGLYTYPTTGMIMTCRGLQDWATTLKSVKWIMWGTVAVTGLIGGVLALSLTTAGRVALLGTAAGANGIALASGGAQGNAEAIHRKLCK